ncbi:sulfite exporter TauE/SafE family protein [Loktanella sp. IMCC34160]|nr:sulfite exporter TauE/SafE family protein [Loktanella sp. IMCC34160]
MPLMPFGLAPDHAIWLAAALLGAAFVRGYSGFGFSAIFIAFAALLTNPVPLIPAIFACEIVMTLFLLPSIRGAIDWRLVGLLTLGAAIAILPAVWVMARLEEDTARLAVSALIFALGLVLLSGWRLERRVGGPGYLGIGAVSGMANAAGVGGLPVAGFMTAQPLSPQVFRAVMVVYLFFLDLMTLPVMGLNGLVSRDTFIAAGMAFPILGAGIWLGSRRFGHASPTAFRRAVVVLLLLLSGLGLWKALT